ncbi:hypothetical protein [Mesorhizobium kowhaii]|nr:hypothetical protein [Mesorhizobium kowhaii]
MARLTTAQTLTMLGLTHRNSLRNRNLHPTRINGRNYYDKDEVQRLADGYVIYTQPSPTASDPEYMARITNGFT